MAPRADTAACDRFLKNSSSTVDETDTPLVLGKEKTGIPSPTLSRGANGLGGLPVSLAVVIACREHYKVELTGYRRVQRRRMVQA